MLPQLVLAAAVVSAAALNPVKFPYHGRIVGGQDADVLDFPYQVSLQYHSSHMCGGSIISEHYVVTAAHCTDQTKPSDLSVRVNTSVVGSGGTVYNITKIHQNPKYDPWIVDFDISILELSESLEFGPGINRISLPRPSETIANGTKVLVTGWGTLTEGDPELSSVLQVVEVNIVDNDVCQKDYFDQSITSRMICAGVPEGGSDSCQGDSGGPLVADGSLWGIVSWGYGCAREGYPGVYGSVAGLRDFITKITGL